MQYQEILTVKVCLYPNISWEYPKYSQFWSNFISCLITSTGRASHEVRANFRCLSVYISKEALRPFTLSPLDILICNPGVAGFVPQATCYFSMTIDLQH